MRQWITILFLIVLFSSCSERAPDVSELDKLPIEPAVLRSNAGEYGLVLDDLEVKKGKIGKNQFLADILLGQGVGYPMIERLVEMAAPFLDVRKIRAGDEYALVSVNDSVERLAYFIYEEDPVNAECLELQDWYREDLKIKESDQLPVVILLTDDGETLLYRIGFDLSIADWVERALGGQVKGKR